jgi:2-polyprenyl-3-methyl-5-hydroxy-6-metoxy-1,4-benzoquinol methylase
MSSNLTENRKQASIQSKGLSGQEIYEEVISQVSKINLRDNVLDVGCGTGILLNEIHKVSPESSLTGADLTDFSGGSSKSYIFHECDLNNQFHEGMDQFDIVTSIEVIEHLENPRQYIRSLAKTVKSGGRLLISTPNLDSWTSIISFVLRGYHSAFGPRDYPAHITALSEYELLQIAAEVEGISLTETVYIENGRVPGTSFLWRNVLPFLKGKRYSDNYLCIFKKI